MAKSPLSDPIATRIPVDVLSSIDEIAEMTERTRSWVIVRALKTYLLNEGADILAFKNGRKQIDAGRHEDMDDVIRDIEQIVAGKVA
ncbi:CopG family ribbon-helix-helix protein [Roseibium aggregatum]|uniref:Ribbon-helix-helix protein, CopG family n=1 Tax=Roseibium aggregatum TaxID=187304 RepID=A0A926S9F5_9HYPH|nr:ribbon-helix-helix protein, CopG family [Roseibium aggregatum]MBD1546879.1 ribbon-helix-helix protein, CopG family [Roseibium aggregatum]